MPPASITLVCTSNLSNMKYTTSVPLPFLTVMASVGFVILEYRLFVKLVATMTCHLHEIKVAKYSLPLPKKIGDRFAYLSLFL